jgi:hypothetical protein
MGGALSMSEHKRNLLCISALMMAAALIFTGIIIGEPSVIFAKAVRICMECVGIG